MALALLGTGLIFGALTSVLLALVFPPLIGWRFVRDEEVGLRAAFGAEAERYLASTRRW